MKQKSQNVRTEWTEVGFEQGEVVILAKQSEHLRVV